MCIRDRSYTDAFIKFGYKPIRQVMFYGLVGPSIADWSHTTQQISVNGTTGVDKPINEFDMKEKTVGLGVGGGIEYLIKDKYAISFEYAFHKHRSKSVNRTMTYYKYPNYLQSTFIKTVQPSYSTFAIRLSYFFSL
jgi:opacity protein-like surface antigen